MALKKIGALWLKDGKKGKFMSGEIELDGVKTKILVFKNSKQKETHPDYQIQMPVDEGQSGGYNDSKQAPPTSSHFDDDIPF